MSKFGGERISVELPDASGNSEQRPPGAFTLKLAVAVELATPLPLAPLANTLAPGVPPPAPLLWGLSPECVRSCCFRLEVWEKDFPHTEQEWGRSPECSWLVDCVKALLQTEQTYGFRPRWTFLCRRRLLEFLKGFSPE
uniref:Uncharacterized protein n=1 Tax=Denticeps clupeoides TaxID=299321 RepID=A0AAY4AIZ6_9TELE